MLSSLAALTSGHSWDHFECDCSWRSKYACPLDELFLTKIDRSGDGHIDRHEAIDLNADGFLTSTELVAADTDGDGQSSKHEAILARSHAGTDGFATDDGSACFTFASLRLDEETPDDLIPDGLPPVAATPAMDEEVRHNAKLGRPARAP
ncbi:hypothetical protein EMIHUDRAFT_212900 [Emiliania huxleyi CCMP1516]|uniref:EF-hand domain-containing protein n=2 Tax=Emiliania huxleyi TaxID=2903 RepID=A0A0D3IPH1_EMIH1|nr:hypothetical protein EMIHUDRAFT_212900 [Emiliania huxleyi CCMP1516]EOD13156.1 hypothetical protein EMIHUDRAFT_212900 [Emiliania huxleyi CCMP1516]|eukprot:XP_005765585.1 hypothetical protein EMIHUDRAFT_212900 [Emiliania huxleyi CCMP1516]